MKDLLDRYFGVSDQGSTFGREAAAGLTTFIAMAYIIVVNPKILQAAGIPFGPCMAATILSAFFGSLTMGVYAKLPIAIAPYMGQNAFIGYTVCQIMGYSWQTALGAIVLSGIFFTVITLCGIRSWLAQAIPDSMKRAFAVGVGLFLAFIGMNTTGIVVLGEAGAPVKMGDVGDPAVLLAVAGFLLTTLLMAWRVKGAIILSILAVTGAAFLLGVADPPEAVFSAPPSLAPTFLEFDLFAAVTWGFFSVVLSVLVLDFVDTLGTLYAVALQGGMLDENHELPDVRKPMLADALATTLAGVLGTTSAGAYLESATGIEAGGRTGLTAVTTALLFLLALFLSPLLTAAPACAYGPALIAVGLLMMRPMREMDMQDMSEAVPSFLIITLMSFTYDLGIGITAGFVFYPLLKLFTGRGREVSINLWALCLISAAFFVFYPQ